MTYQDFKISRFQDLEQLKISRFGAAQDFKISRFGAAQDFKIWPEHIEGSSRSRFSGQNSIIYDTDLD